MVGAIYNARRLCVKDSGHESSVHHQWSGISEGRPLSPFLFVVLMTVLISDVDWDVKEKFGADDTMLLETDKEVLRYTMERVMLHGRQYGLEPNLDKTELL